MGNCRGFTLIEVLITLIIASVSMTVLTMYCLTQQKSTVVSTNVSDMQQSLRAAMDFMIRDIRMAGYDPTGSKEFGFLDIGFWNSEGRDLSPGLFQIAYDTDEDGELDGNEIISYSLSDSSTVAPGSLALVKDGQPIAGYIVNMSFAFAIDNDEDGKLEEDSSGNTLWLVDSDSDGEWNNVEDGSEIGLIVSGRDIRAVRIWLLARSAAPDNDYKDTTSYDMGSYSVQPNDRYHHRLMERSVLCRNAGLSL